MKFQNFIDSGFIGKSVDKLKGSSVGIYIDPSSREVSEDTSAEEERKAVERLTGKKIWVVVKGTSACRDYIKSLIDAKSPEIKQIGEGYYEIPFEDFSLYNKPLIMCWSEILMDAREVILPLKKAVEYGSPRGYVFTIHSGRKNSHYFLPYLKYPKAVKPFLDWLKKKKKITLPKGKLFLWNKDQKISTDYANPGMYNISSWEIDIQEFGVGVPMSNIKTSEQIEDYNTRLKNDIKPVLEKSKKDLTNCPRCVYGRDTIVCPDHIKITTVDMTQETIDEYIKEANSVTYKVLR